MAGAIRIAILANGAQARREAMTTGRAFSGMGKTLGRAGAAVGLTSLAAGAAGLVKNAVDLEAKFSTTMRTIGAATGAAGGELKTLNDLAIKLGADTAFSANEAADAMLELAKAGIDTKTIVGGGLAGTLQLAAAGGTELGTAATIASNALNAFNLGGKDMASVAAALAGGANASSASVESLGQGLSQVSAGAVNAGLSLQETVGALSAFDAAGIKGSDAGTSLKTMLQRLVPTTNKAQEAMEDLGLDFVKGNGQFESLTNIAGQLQKRLGGLSDAQRSVALQTIFGSDSQRAAAVLMRQGADGIRKYIKATKDQTAAQKMAEARMGGTAGAMERLSGAMETAQLRLGQELAPTVTKVADLVGDNLGPAMEAVIDNAKVFADAIDPAVEVLKAVGKAAVGAVRFLDGLPGPVKEIGIQAGIAALVMPRLAGAVTSVTSAVGFNIRRLQQLRAELTYTTTRAQIASTAMRRLGSAARGAAGVGGMVALTQGAEKGNTAVGGLMKTLGGAAIGLAVGGPVGAAIGGLGTAFTVLKGHMDSVNKGWSEAKPKALDYADTLDKVTGAATKATRALIEQDLQQRGLISSGASLGLSTKTLVGAVMGNDRALRQVRNSWKDYGNVLEGVESQRVKDFIQSLRYDLHMQGQAARNSAGTTEAAQARVRQSVQNLSKTYRQTPKQVRTIVRAVGTDDSRANVRALARQYNVTPKQIRTIFRVVNAARVKGEAKGVGRAIENTGKVRPSNKWVALLTGDINAGKRRAGQGGRQIGESLRNSTARARPNLGPFGRILGGELSGFKKQASSGGAKIGSNLREGTAKARPELSPFARVFAGDLSGLKGTASSGGAQIGSNLGSGIAGGISLWVGPIAANAAAAVRAAVAAAKAAAKIKSPSRVMRDEVGKRLGEGLVLGLRAKEKAAARAGRRLMRRLLKGVDDGRDGIRSSLDKVTALIEKKLDGKKQAGRRKALLASLRDEYKALKRNGAAQDRVTRKMEKARQKLQELRRNAREYRNTIRDSIVDYGSVVGLGQIGGSANVISLKGLLSQLEARAKAAERWGVLLERLRKAGLNRTSIQDLLDAGVEGGLATAEAIAAGGASAIKQINALTSQIGSTGTRLGDKMTKAYHQAGVRAAEGLVRGLEKRQRQLDRVAERLATSLVKKVKKALGIKSPSRVFRQIGDETLRGLAIGLDETYARRIGAATAGALVTGFGSPALDAYRLSGGTTGATGGEVTVKLTAQQLSDIQQGRELTMKIDAFRRAGGRAGTF